MLFGASLEDLTASLAQQVRAYLASETSTDTLAFEDAAIDPVRAMRTEHMVILGVGGPGGLLIAFSFSQELGDHLLDQATDQFPPERRLLYRRSVLTQAASRIVDSWRAGVGPSGSAVSDAPTVILDGAQDGHHLEGAIFAGRSLMTDAGSVDIHLAYSRSQPQENFPPVRALQ